MASIKEKIDHQFHSQKFKRLQSIGIMDVTLTPQDMIYLINKKNVQKIKELSFRNCQIGPLSAKQLAHGKWPSLQTLQLTKTNSFGEEGCAYISIMADCKITKLSIAQSRIGFDGVKQLLKSHWMKLSILSLGQNVIGDAGCKWLSCGNWKDLSELYLKKNQISKSGCRWLCKANWKLISKIELNENQICQKGCRYLGDCDWQKILILDISLNKIRDEGLLHLLESNWKKITYFDASKNNILNKSHNPLYFVKCFPKLGYSPM